MLVIRLFRVGKKNQPSFKVVVTDKKNPPRAGRFVEQVGFYNPLTKQTVLKKERVEYWISKGAQPSPTAYNLFVKNGILQGKKIAVHKKSKKPAEAAIPTSTLVVPVAETPKEKKEEPVVPEGPVA